MKIVLSDDKNYILRFDPNEEITRELSNFCEKEKLFAGTITGIGSASEVTISFYNLDTKQYESVTVARRMEIVSLLGNVALLEGKPFAHLHGIFSDADMQPISGHVKELVVSATCEIALTRFDGEVRRAHDPKTGLNLLV